MGAQVFHFAPLPLSEEAGSPLPQVGSNSASPAPPCRRPTTPRFPRRGEACPRVETTTQGRPAPGVIEGNPSATSGDPRSGDTGWRDQRCSCPARAPPARAAGTGRHPAVQPWRFLTCRWGHSRRRSSRRPHSNTPAILTGRGLPFAPAHWEPQSCGPTPFWKWAEVGAAASAAAVTESGGHV